VNQTIQNLVVVLFLFGLIASSSIGIQYSDAVFNNASKIQTPHNLVVPIVGGAGSTTILNAPYKVTVNFDSITVHNNHDHASVFTGPRDCCGGEWDLAAFVQGKAVDLTAASNDNLYDVDQGQTLYFEPGTQVTVDVPKTLPLSIMTLGTEDDCGPSLFGIIGTALLFLIPGGFLLVDNGFTAGTGWPDLAGVLPILKGPPSQWFDGLSAIQSNFAQGIANYDTKPTQDCIIL
jgi:hypothetical protein